VEGGGISLGRAGQTDNAAKVAGDVYVGAQGLFTGNGRVGGSLFSSGLLFPGLSDAPGSALTVDGSVRNDGELRLLVRPGGVANRLLVGQAADLSGTRVSMAGLDGGGPFPYGRFEVLQANAVIGQPVNDSAEALQGVTLLHSFALNTGATSLSAVYDHSTASPRAKALSEGFISGAALLTQGADILAGPGMDSALRAAREARAGSGAQTGIPGLAAFGTVSGGRLRYNTGSHVEMDSLSLMTGLAKNLDAGPGRLTLGAFFEYGNGSYDTYNAFSNAASVHGNGDTYYVGGGILGRFEFARAAQEARSSGVYVEASGRAGETHNEYAGRDLRDARGTQANYESSSPYYGLHLGAGYVWELTDRASLDLYGKYFWTRQEGNSVTLSTNDPVDFDAVASSRLRFGARVAYAVHASVQPYLGAAYEYEFDGVAEASTYGADIAAPSLRGASGIGELGLRLVPSPRLPLSFDLGVQGYTGKREGATGSLQARLEF
jgi:hypothetical protein